jgi:hypothetical protein
MTKPLVKMVQYMISSACGGVEPVIDTASIAEVEKEARS